jgi:hypothetical protein
MDEKKNKTMLFIWYRVPKLNSSFYEKCYHIAFWMCIFENLNDSYASLFFSDSLKLRGASSFILYDRKIF